jgi:hypothetical protein
MVAVQHDRLAKWRLCNMTDWQNGGCATWRTGKMAAMQHDGLAKWRLCNMTDWQNGVCAT